MAEPDDGLELIRQRMARASRRPPPPRRARPDAGDAGVAVAAPAEVGEGGTAPPAPEPVEPAGGAAASRPEDTARPGAAGGGAAAARSSRPRASGARRAAPIRLAADLPSVNLAIRVRRPLDDRLADLIHRLRQDGVRTSKVELIEMLLWELDPEPADAVARLARFREWAARGAGAPLG